MAASEGDPEGPGDVIEPGSPRLVNVFVVLLGVASALAVVYHLVTLFG